MDKEGVIKHINKLLDNKKVADIQKISLLEKWEVLTMKYFDEKNRTVVTLVPDMTAGALSAGY